MGQRNEETLRAKMEEAQQKLEEYNQLEMDSMRGSDKEKLYQMKAKKCRHFIEFSRWQLGVKKELEL